MSKEYVFAILSIIVGVIGIINISKNKDDKIADSLFSNFNYWKVYLAAILMIIIGVMWLLQLSEVIDIYKK